MILYIFVCVCVCNKGAIVLHDDDETALTAAYSVGVSKVGDFFA